MRILPFIIAGVMMVMFAVGFESVCHAEDIAKTSQANIYDESANGDRQVAEAVVIARKDHKRILLEFGANWCEWCRRLHGLFESDGLISAELRSNYVFALIDVNRGHNEDLVVKYEAKTGYGLPFLVVLDSDGTHLITKHSDDFEDGNHHNPQKVLAFLKTPLMLNPPKPDCPIENTNAVRDENNCRQIATTLLEMRHQWATNNYRSTGLALPRFLAEQGQVNARSAGILGAYVKYDFQRDGIEWSRELHILRANTNATAWVLYEDAAPKDTNLLRFAWHHELITVTGEP